MNACKKCGCHEATEISEDLKKEMLNSGNQAIIDAVGACRHCARKFAIAESKAMIANLANKLSKQEVLEAYDHGMMSLLVSSTMKDKHLINASNILIIGCQVILREQEN